jgi:hypothetical protein
MAADDGDYPDLFEQALRVPDAGRWPFDLARIQLAYGCGAPSPRPMPACSSAPRSTPSSSSAPPPGRHERPANCEPPEPAASGATSRATSP